jgi:hypothetical protein
MSNLVKNSKFHIFNFKKYKTFSRKFFPDCPISIFNFIPDVYTRNDDVTVEFDAPETEESTEQSVDQIILLNFFKVNMLVVSRNLWLILLSKI